MKFASQFCEAKSTTICYPVAVILASTLNVVRLVALEDTESVMVADRTWFAAIVEPSLFQAMVIGPLADVGFQFVFVKLSVA